MADSDRLGFWYDIGHAQALDRLAFFPHEEWLKRFADRIVGVHLHDVLGIIDHDIPGCGEIDFGFIAPYLPTTAIRTLEVRPGFTPAQLRDGLRCLANAGCIRQQAM
jgi:sugar phosphate isomerase/epimerase